MAPIKVSSVGWCELFKLGRRVSVCLAFLARPACLLTGLLLPSVLPNPRTLQLQPCLHRPREETAVRWPVARGRGRGSPLPAPTSSLSAQRTAPPAPVLMLCGEVSGLLCSVPRLGHVSQGGARLPSRPGCACPQKQQAERSVVNRSH